MRAPERPANLEAPWPRRVALLVGVAVLVAAAPLALAHGVAEGDKAFILRSQGAQIGPFVYLGAKHMVTGYDHLLFLVGVIFFLHRLRDVAIYVSMFTLGHSSTLLFGVLADVRANPFLIDAVIGLSVVYKGFDNVGGFRRLLGFQPETRSATLVFGLFHGFGLATKLQEFELPREGLVANLLSFNLGVEIGQMLSLGIILVAMTWWRCAPSFARHAFATNALLMMGGFILLGYQLAGYFVEGAA